MAGRGPRRGGACTEEGILGKDYRAGGRGKASFHSRRRKGCRGGELFYHLPGDTVVLPVESCKKTKTR